MSYNEDLQSNNADLMAILNAVNDLPSGGSDREWTKIADVDCSVASGDIKVTNLDNLTYLFFRSYDVKNASTTDSGYALYINDIQVCANAFLHIKNQSTSIVGYQESDCFYNGLYWTVNKGLMHNTDGMVQANESYKRPYSNIMNVGKATKITLGAPVLQYRTTEGHIEIWGK